MTLITNVILTTKIALMTKIFLLTYVTLMKKISMLTSITLMTKISLKIMRKLLKLQRSRRRDLAKHET